MKVFITREIPAAGLTLLKEQGLEMREWKEKRELTEEEFVTNCQWADGILLSGRRRVDAAFLKTCPHLKVISLFSVGYDNVDINAASALKIPVGNTPDVLTQATANIAFLLMIATSRKAFFRHKRIQKGDWDFFEPTANLGISLYGKTLGVFGLGNIGFEMARLCKASYGMDIIYHNRSHNMKAEQEFGARYVSFDELLAQSDVLSVHANLTEALKGVFNKTAFDKMKPNAIFINTARGGMHNETDLKAALLSKTIWGAAGCNQSGTDG